MNSPKIALIVLLFFIASAIPTFAYSKGNPQLNITYNLSTKDLYGRTYTPYCLIDCDMPIPITIGGTLKPTTISYNDLSFIKSKIVGLDSLESLTYEYLANESYKYKTHIPNVTCIGEGNETICEDNGYYKDIDSWHMVWKPLDIYTGSVNLNNFYAINLHGKKKLSQNFSAVDVVPSLFTLQMAELTWWNTSFPYKRALTVNTGTARTNYATWINITNVTNMNTNCTDVRFVNASENEEIPYWLEQSNANWCFFWFSDSWATTNGTQAYIYYGNASVSTSTSNGKLTFPLFDDFEDASFNTTIWSNVSTAPTESGGILNQSPTGTWREVYTTESYGATVCIMARVQWKEYSTDNMLFGFFTPSGGAPTAFFQTNFPTASSLNSRSYISSGSPYWGDNKTWATNSTAATWQYTSICRRDTTSIDYSVNHTTWYNATSNVTPNSLTSRMSTLTSGKWIASDWWVIRNYTHPDPDATLGSEQTSGGANNTSWVRLYINGTESNASTVYGNSSNLTATINVTGFWVAILRNGTVIANGTNSIQNINITGAGYYNITAYGQNNTTYPQNYTTYWLNISKAPNPLSLSNNYSWSFSYPNATNITGYGNLTNATLYRNGSDVSNPNLRLYASANYNFTYYTAGNANYSTNSTTTWLNVSRAIPTVSLTINLTSYNITYGNVSLTICTENTPESSANLYRNHTTDGVSWTSLDVTASENNSAVLLPAYNDTPSYARTHVYMCNTTQTENYTTASNNSSNIVIYQGNPNLNVTFNTSDTVTEGTIVNISCTYPTQLTANFYNDTSNISNPFILNTTGLLGNYNYTCNASGNANYTAGNDTRSLTVTASSGLSVYVYNEENFSQSLMFNITINNGTFSNTAYNQSNPYVNNSITGYITVDVSGADYPQRTYFTQLNVGNVSIINASLLASGSGSWVLFYIYNTIESPISSALIDVERLIPPSNYMLVAEKLTDASGAAAIFLSQTTTYRINISATGYTSKSISLQPSASPYKIYLLGSSFTTNYTSSLANITYEINPVGTSLLNNTNYTLWFYVNSSDSQLQWYGWNITYYNGTSLSYQNISNNVGGNISYSLNTGIYQNNTYLTAWFKRNNYSSPSYLYYNYSVSSVNIYNTSLMASIDDIKTGSFTVDAKTFALISVILTVVFMSIISSPQHMFGSGVIGIGIQFALTLLGTYIYGASYLIGWEMLIVISLGVIGMIYIRGGFQ